LPAYELLTKENSPSKVAAADHATLNGGWISDRWKPPSGEVSCTLRQASSISRFATTLRFAKSKWNVEDSFPRYFPDLASEVQQFLGLYLTLRSWKPTRGPCGGTAIASI
jgi:hypothetical protein